MAKFTTLRLFETAPRIVGRSPSDYAQELQEFLEKLLNKAVAGIPAGFNAIVASVIQAGVSSDSGSESSGWAAADHAHGILTAAPADISLGASASEGTSPALARADHVHGTIALQSEILALIEEESYLSWVM